MTRASVVKGAAWAIVWLCVAIVTVFFIIRVATDATNIAADRSVPAAEFDSRYAAHPVAAYLHIIPGMVFLLGATHQLSIGLRRRNPERHRRVGRGLIVAGLVSAIFAIGFGVLHSYGGFVEAGAAVVFGSYLGVALVLGRRAARRRDIEGHRRWMIRAVALATGVASIRIVIGLGEATGLVSFDGVFAVAFWIGLTAHAIGAEVWLRRRPHPSGISRAREAVS